MCIAKYAYCNKLVWYNSLSLIHKSSFNKNWFTNFWFMHSVDTKTSMETRRITVTIDCRLDSVLYCSILYWRMFCPEAKHSDTVLRLWPLKWMWYHLLMEMSQSLFLIRSRSVRVLHFVLMITRTVLHRQCIQREWLKHCCG